MAIFVNYRRADTSAIVGRIDDHLRRVFGDADVFRDIDSIPPGVDFVEHIEGELARCDVCLCVIGPAWQPERLKDEGDWVRRELEVALQGKIFVIPVLAEGAALPPEEGLPPTLRPLVQRHWLRIDSGADFKVAMERLVRAIRGRRRPWHRRRSVGLAALGVVVGGAAALALHLPRGQVLETAVSAASVASSTPTASAASHRRSSDPTRVLRTTTHVEGAVPPWLRWPGCMPPFVVDAAGRRVVKDECVFSPQRLARLKELRAQDDALRDAGEEAEAERLQRQIDDTRSVMEAKVLDEYDRLMRDSGLRPGG